MVMNLLSLQTGELSLEQFFNTEKCYPYFLQMNSCIQLYTVVEKFTVVLEIGILTPVTVSLCHSSNRACKNWVCILHLTMYSTLHSHLE